MDAQRVPKQEWKPREMLDELLLEAQFDGGDAAAATSRLLREHALAAASSIAHLAVYGGNERVRLMAAEYIVDKVLQGGLNEDVKLFQEQQQLVGQALFLVVKALGQHFGFDPQDPVVKGIAHKSLITIGEGKEDV